jgi:hypothetical protein
MKKSYIVLAVMAGLAMVNSAMAQSVTVDVPSGYKVVIVPSSTTVPQAVAVAPAPSQTVYAAPAPAPVYHRVRGMWRAWRKMVIEHQYDDHH